MDRNRRRTRRSKTKQKRRKNRKRSVTGLRGGLSEWLVQDKEGRFMSWLKRTLVTTSCGERRDSKVLDQKKTEKQRKYRDRDIKDGKLSRVRKRIKRSFTGDFESYVGEKKVVVKDVSPISVLRVKKRLPRLYHRLVIVFGTRKWTRLLNRECVLI